MEELTSAMMKLEVGKKIGASWLLNSDNSVAEEEIIGEDICLQIDYKNGSHHQHLEGELRLP